MYYIKDWHKFQHYKTGRGAPPWIKLYRDLLNDRDWFLLEPDAAKFLVSCWIIAAEKDGVLPDSDMLAFRLRLASKETVRLLNLCKHWILSDASDLLANCYQLATPETETETEKKESKKVARAHRLPEDWQPSEQDRAFAVSQGIEVEREAMIFKNYWLSKGKNDTKTDWSRTWQNWCLKNTKPTIPIAKPVETFRIGHTKGLVKPEPKAPELTPEEKEERARRVDAILRGARKPVEGLGDIGS